MNSKKSVPVTIIIATLDRVDDLSQTLTHWRANICLPTEVRIVDASDTDLTRQLCNREWSPLQVTYYRSLVKSAAQQRNLGSQDVETQYLLFCDDDVKLPSDTLAKFMTVFEDDVAGKIGGVAGTIEGYNHQPPSRLLHKYFYIQAGYKHPTYGGHYFGASINLLPTDQADDPELYPSQWLNSTLVMYRTALFQKERFPLFSGYSFQEDVNLSARIGRTHNLYFHRGIRYVHKSSPGIHKANRRQLAAMQFTNQWYNANKLLELGSLEQWSKFTLSQVVNSVLLLRSHQSGWGQQLIGSWTAWWRLAVLRQKAENLLSQQIS